MASSRLAKVLSETVPEHLPIKEQLQKGISASRFVDLSASEEVGVSKNAENNASNNIPSDEAIGFGDGEDYETRIPAALGNGGGFSRPIMPQPVSSKILHRRESI